MIENVCTVIKVYHGEANKLVIVLAVVTIFLSEINEAGKNN